MSDTPAGATTSKDLEYADDAHGNVSMLLDSSGKAQASYGYSAYGQSDDAMTQERDPSDFTKILDPKSAATNPLNLYRFSDKRLDPASGSLDMGARRFGPDTSHFLQEDVYNDALGDLDLATDPLTQNRYSLAGGNPVSFIEAMAMSRSAPTRTAARSTVPRGAARTPAASNPPRPPTPTTATTGPPTSNRSTDPGPQPRNSERDNPPKRGARRRALRDPPAGATSIGLRITARGLGRPTARLARRPAWRAGARNS